MFLFMFRSNFPNFAELIIYQRKLVRLSGFKIKKFSSVKFLSTFFAILAKNIFQLGADLLDNC
jgi:hypothetical protein